MQSILSMILKTERELIDGIEVDWSSIHLNLNVSDEFLLKNSDKMKGGFLRKNCDLIRKYPEKANWLTICRNPSDELIDVILENIDRLNKNHKIRLLSSTNPRLANFIIQNQQLKYIANNSNPGLTDYIIENWNKLPPTKFKNKNPKLFGLIMNDPNPDWRFLSGRVEIEFAEFLINHKNDLIWREVSFNSNPGLTKFLICNESDLYWPEITRNKNPRLMKLKIKNKLKLDWNYISQCYGQFLLDNIELANWKFVSRNKTPILTQLIMDNYDKLDYKALSSNKNKKLDSFKLKHLDKLDHKKLSLYINITRLSNRFYWV